MPEPKVDYSRPTEALKLTGSPVVVDSDARVYAVHLPLSRPMTEFEQEAVGHRQTAAGSLYAHDTSFEMLTLPQTTIEHVRDHLPELHQLVRDIAASGETIRARAEESIRKLTQQGEEKAAERDRRRKLAEEVSLDE